MRLSGVGSSNKGMMAGEIGDGRHSIVVLKDGTAFEGMLHGA